MYAVVKFIPTESDDCEEVEAVPIGWLSPGRSRCFWPPMKSGAAIHRAIKNGIPHGPKWIAHRAQVMKICGMKCFYVMLIVIVIKFTFSITIRIVTESIRMTEDRDKWRKYVHGVANPRIEDG